jgi:predicted nucleic acid-binding protein
VYDATCVALAELQNAIFITADEQLANRLEQLPFVRFLGDVGEE